MNAKERERYFKEYRRQSRRRQEYEDACAMALSGFFWLLLWALVMYVSFSSFRL